MEYFVALEQGRLDVIPAPIRRGVISAYAQTASMNADKVLKRLEELQDEKPPPAQVSTITTRWLSRDRLTVGMTRAQIRTEWFASIAGNRFLHWSLTVLILLVGLVLASQWSEVSEYASRTPPQNVNVPAPVSSFRSDCRFEFWEVPPDSLRPSSLRTVHESVLVALDTCEFDINWGIIAGPTVILYPHDKAILRHNSGVRITVGRYFSGLLIAQEDTLSLHFTKDSTTAWLCFPDAAAEIAADSTLLTKTAKG